MTESLLSRRVLRLLAAAEGNLGSLAEIAKQFIWGADRIDRIDSKSMQPSETLGLLAIFLLKGRIL